jgi:hypothetical protein
MQRIFTSALILLAIGISQCGFNCAFAQKEEKPQISITPVPIAVDKTSKDKPLKVKTTILTQKTETESTEKAATILKPSKRDVELSTDVDKILKEMDIDDSDPLTETPQNSVESMYKPVKKNFIWIAFSVILFPIILFSLLVKAMQIAKTRFEEEKKQGPSKEEKLLVDLEKEQKKAKKKKISLSELLGGHKQSNRAELEDDFDRDDEDFEFMVEEVVVVDDEPKTTPQKPTTKSKPQEQKISIKPSDENTSDSEIIDTFEISETLKFTLNKKDDSTNLLCHLNDQKIIIMRLDKAQKFNKVRKIDSKPGRDVYMVKLDSWRGLVEVKENDAKYLMDI